ncbi:hypothetical protein K431DRAFT_314868 [Polychaeton citri CBS 116435]|uniref:Uncharacterized protein n=1 Tax=Polychaeton citri CBS 116435 TaxID=1314669 RepID=A0A9P4UN26_9PEZI|nr:hypothetical protein K431DRAFT_314868 [Polychaeton citri CBS 116435]
MFCLRSWVPLLIFLTNASPIYITLFLTANYALQRPCVYCSLLLMILVWSLFDFSADWFEPRSANSPSQLVAPAESWINGNSTFTDAVLETASLALSTVNGTGGSAASAVLDAIAQRAGVPEGAAANGSESAFVGLRAMLEKWQFRIPCVDVVVRL